MSEWGIALIAAGSAILGSVVTGFFAWKASHRQAGAAEYAGNRQADALIATVQATLDEQRRAQASDRRRQTYTRFLVVADDAHRVTQHPNAEERGSVLSMRKTLLEAKAPLDLEGPEAVIAAADAYHVSLLAWVMADDIEARARCWESLRTSRLDYLAVTRQALNGT